METTIGWGQGVYGHQIWIEIANKSRILHSVETDLAGAGHVTIVRLNDQKRVTNLTIQ